MKLIKRYRILISWTVIALTAFFFAKTLQQNWNNLEGVTISPNHITLAALIFFVLSIISSGYLWGEIVEKLTRKKVSRTEVIRVHLASWLLKYIPGQAGSLINKLAWGKSKKIDGKLITASFIYENVFLILASTLPTIPILFVGLSSKFFEGATLFLPLLLALPLVIIVLTPWFFTPVINRLFKLVKKQTISRQEMLSTSESLKFFLKFIIPRILNGAAFVLVVESIINVEPEQYIVFASLYVLAGIIGVLAIFVPSGLGVREAAIVLFASAYIPAEQAIILALVARFYATIADVLVAGIYLSLKRRIPAQ